MDRFAIREKEMAILKQGIVSDIKEMLIEKGKNVKFNPYACPKHYNRIYIDNYGQVIVSGDEDERNIERGVPMEELLQILRCMYHIY